jgi:hypothetical protein
LNSSYGAVGETRTRTIIQSLPPQDSVSANSTTTAWWALQDSNLRPIGYEPTALPAELRALTGVPEEIRTPDTRLRRPLLYPAELLGHFRLEGAPGFEPGNKGFADLCLTTWLCSHNWGDRWESNPRMSEPQSDALTTSPRPPLFLAGTVGIEPTLEVLETSVLPLNYVPIGCGDRI